MGRVRREIPDRERPHVRIRRTIYGIVLLEPNVSVEHFGNLVESGHGRLVADGLVDLGLADGGHRITEGRRFEHRLDAVDHAAVMQSVEASCCRYFHPIE